MHLKSVISNFDIYEEKGLFFNPKFIKKFKELRSSGAKIQIALGPVISIMRNNILPPEYVGLVRKLIIYSKKDKYLFGRIISDKFIILQRWHKPIKLINLLNEIKMVEEKYRSLLLEKDFSAPPNEYIAETMTLTACNPFPGRREKKKNENLSKMIMLETEEESALKKFCQN